MGRVPGDDNKRDPERENLAVLTIAAQTANVIHIRVTFIVATRYLKEVYHYPASSFRLVLYQGQHGLRC